MNTDASPSIRRWLRFSLRTFLVVVVVVSSAFGWLGVKIRWARDQQTVDQLLRAEPEQVSQLLAKITSYRRWVVSELESVLSPDITLPAEAADRHLLFCRQSNAAVALTILGRNEKVWPLFKHSTDPTRRSFLVNRYAASGGDPGVLLERLGKESDASIRRALILALGEFDRGQLSDADAFVTLLLRLHERDPDPGIHGATECVLRRWQREEWLADNDRKQWETVMQQLATGNTEGGRNWYLTKQGFTMSVMEGGEYWYGDPPVKRQLDQRFAISTTEVTVEQIRRFLRATGREDFHKTKISPQDDCPVNLVSWYLAAEYCNWLTDQENKGRADDEQLEKCYEPNTRGDFGAGMTIQPGCNGYRLPTDLEWEYACRAGNRTDFSFGDARELMVGYVWYGDNQRGKAHPVANLKPNDVGLFDMHGNVWEWCQSQITDSAGTDSTESNEVTNLEDRVLRGGSFNYSSVNCRSAVRDIWGPANRNGGFGFRVSRTYP